jgi:anhydro-N-acetylmuramic acid kinase
MIVAGVMSGTSADGVNVALVRLGGPQARPRARANFASGRLELIGHEQFAYSRQVRAAVLAAMNSRAAEVAELAQLNFLLGELYADAVLATQKKYRARARLIGCHGQTLYHQGDPRPFLGKRLAVTWQTGEAAILAARAGAPVISDFRPADMAAGGQGAPLVPYLDYVLYRHRRIGRIAQNIGGIANLTAIPRGARLDAVVAFDTGPGNMVLDALAEELFAIPFDRDGRIAARGMVIEAALKEFLRHEFFRRPPPKTAGREQFGREFARVFLARCRKLRASSGAKFRDPKADILATATALTAVSIADAVRRFVLPLGEFSELIASGGGCSNRTLMGLVARELAPYGIRLRRSDDLGIPTEAKEAVAFALLAYETWRRRPSNVPSATGAHHPAVLGKIAYP